MAACARVRVASSGDLGARWHDAIRGLEDEVVKLAEEECADATVSVLSEKSGVRLEVTAGDGRQARRAVAVPSELSAVALGLLASIPKERPPEEPPVTETRSADASYDPDADLVVKRPLAPAAPHGPATVGVSFGGRVGLPTGVIAPELEIRGDIRLSNWVLTLAGRGAPGGVMPSDDAPPGYEYTEYGFALLGGRRFSIADGTLTLSAGPAVAVVSQETNDGAKTHRDVWIESVARYELPFGERWHPTVSLELEVAPRRFAEPDNLESLPDFPVWGGALRLGVAGDVP